VKRWCKRPPATRATGSARQTPPGARSNSARPRAARPSARVDRTRPSATAARDGWSPNGASQGAREQNPAYRPAPPPQVSDLRQRDAGKGLMNGSVTSWCDPPFGCQPPVRTSNGSARRADVRRRARIWSAGRRRPVAPDRDVLSRVTAFDVLADRVDQVWPQSPRAPIGCPSPPRLQQGLGRWTPCGNACARRDGMSRWTPSTMPGCGPSAERHCSETEDAQ
jgi:hypothetical protein